MHLQWLQSHCRFWPSCSSTMDIRGCGETKWNDTGNRTRNTDSELQLSFIARFEATKGKPVAIYMH